MNNLINQVAKIQFSRMGYLPDYPYHLISNIELADAFFDTHVTVDQSEIYVDSSFVNESDFFHSTYQIPSTWSSELIEKYDVLHRAIQLIVGSWKYLQTAQLSSVTVSEGDLTYVLYADKLPDWVYSYMLGRVVGPNSAAADIHDLLVLLGQDNINDEFLESTACSCYKVSSDWLAKFPSTDSRPPSVFGEMHVIKSLRLMTQGE